MLLAIIAISFMLPFALLGLFTIYHWFRPQKAPADTSNRINKIRLWWFALTREDKFTDLFTWLKKDEWENINE